MKKFDKEPIAWITRNGKHVPIFDADPISGEDIKFLSTATDGAGNIVEKISYKGHDVLVYYGYEIPYDPQNVMQIYGMASGKKEKYFGAVVRDWEVGNGSPKRFKNKFDAIKWIRSQIDENDD